MNYSDWKKYYYRILGDFNFYQKKDDFSAQKLSLLLNHEYEKFENIRERIFKKDVIIVGDFKVLNIDKNMVKNKVLIVADDAITKTLEKDLEPDIVVTDLDGDLEDLVYASKIGALIGVHAHGDNVPKLDNVRLFKSRYGTTQSDPKWNVFNFGGFTDGDRAAFLAHHCEAKKIELVSFEFNEPSVKSSKDPEIKAKKLKWAEFLIMELKYRYKANIQIL